MCIAGRSEKSSLDAIEKIKARSKTSSPPSDLANNQPAVQQVMSKESCLDVLWNNAGVTQCPKGAKSKQSHGLVVAVYCLGPFLFTRLLMPTIEATAKNSRPGKVRVIWLASQMIDLNAPKGGVDMEQIRHPPKVITVNYINSKTNDQFLPAEFAKRVTDKGILNLPLSPGNLKTNALRNARLMYYSVSW